MNEKKHCENCVGEEWRPTLNLCRTALPQIVSDGDIEAAAFKLFEREISQ